jgi:hypothetical protein
VPLFAPLADPGMLAFSTGKGGGFILANGGGIYDAKPENMRAMVGTVLKHGWY